MELKRVVVTGLGALTPVGNTVPEFWNNLLNGVSGAGPITHFDASKFKTQFACEVKNFNAADHIDRKEARKMDLYTQYAVVAAKEAVTDAGIDVEKRRFEQSRSNSRCRNRRYSYFRRRSRRLRENKRRPRTEIQSVLYSEDDCRYCIRTDFYHVRLPRT